MRPLASLPISQDGPATPARRRATGIRTIEDLFGSNHADTLHGDGNANSLWGHGGNDTLAGQDGDDLLFGQAGNDVMHGGLGNDSLYGGDGDDWLLGGAGADRLDGGAGIDRVEYSHATAGLTAKLLRPSENTGEAAGDVYLGIENLMGTGFDDRLSGDTGTNTLWGDGGS